jgi:peroxidase
MAENLAKHLFLVILQILLLAQLGSAQLSPTYYNNTCPQIETIVRDAVAKKFHETFSSVGGVIRLLFHDCFVEVSSIYSTSTNTTNNILAYLVPLKNKKTLDMYTFLS